MLDSGALAPGFDLEGIDGERRSLATRMADGPVLLAFFALDCASCDICYLFWDRFHVEYGPNGLELWGISLDSTDDAAAFVERSGVEFPVLIDAGLETVKAYGAVSTPALFLVRADGTIETSHEGFERAAFNEICALASEWTGAEAIEVAPGEAPELRPGCTIHGL